VTRSGGREVEIAGRRLVLTNEDKVLYPAAGFTKRDLVAYYLAVAPAILPHLAGRAVTLARFPDGVDAPGWYQTNCPAGRPAWLPVAEVRGSAGQRLRLCRLEEPAALAWAANAGALELHPLLATCARPAEAGAVVVDLDPAAPAGVLDCARVALRARGLLARDGLGAVVKTSGAKGLHLFAPLRAGATFPEAKAIARALAARLEAAEPIVTSRLPRAGRAGRVLVDWRQNEGGRSMIAPWSLRAATVPAVSTPLGWDEVERAVSSADPDLLRFDAPAALARLATSGDPFAALAHAAGALRETAAPAPEDA
jgi:bifunctional non-homologous end joining protein LigD